MPEITILPPEKEQEFKTWYSERAAKSGIDPDPDRSEQRYDYRAAFLAGAEPQMDTADNPYHWPSQFKANDHPNRFVNQNGQVLDSKYGRVLDEDNLAPAYIAKAERAYADQSPEVQALRKHSTPEEFNQLAPKLGATPIQADTSSGKFSDLIHFASEKYGVDSGLISKMITTESAFNPKAVSPRGAKGVMQLMPGTARDMGVEDPYNPKQNIEGGVKYFVGLVDRYDGDTTRALVAYNWGPTRADKWDGSAASLPEETRNYVQKITGGSGGAAAPKRTLKPSLDGLAWSEEIDVPDTPIPLSPNAQRLALDLSLKGWKPEEIEKEIGGGLDEPPYSPVDFLADLVSGGLTSVGRAGIGAIAKGNIEAGTKQLGRNVALEVGTGALAGETMTAVEAAGAGPLLQAVSGIIGPTATIALMQLPRKGLATYLRSLDTSNPEAYTKIKSAVEHLGESKFAQKIREAFDFSKELLASERGSIRTGAAGVEPPDAPGQPAKAAGSLFEQDPKALQGKPRNMSYIGEHLIADENTLDMLQKYGGNVNLERVDDFKTPDDVRNLINTVAKGIPTELDEARRGATDQETTKKLADELGWSEETLFQRQRGQAFNAEQVTAARLIMMDSGAKLLDLAKRIRAGDNSDEMLALFRERLSVHSAIQAQVSGLTAEAGRALAAFRIMAAPGEMRLREVQQVIETSGGRGSLEGMADVLADIAGRQGGQLDPAQINTVVRKLQKATTADALLEAWIMGLLSGPQTHVVNMMSNTITALLQIPERKLASWVSQAVGSGEIPKGEAGAMYHGLISGLQDGFRLAAKALKTGEGSDLLGKVETPRRAIAGETFGLTEGGALAKGVDYLGEVVRLPGRFLGAEDEFFKAVGYRMEVQAQAYRQAASEGLTGDAMAGRIMEIVTNPPDNIRIAAIDAARYQTFTSPLGRSGQMVQGAMNENKFIRIIVPFFRTPVNILKFSLERTPLAPVMDSVRADIMAGGARRDLAISRIGLGTGIMTVAGSLSAAGYITGAGPADRDMREILKRKGWQPYSIKIGDTYVAYNRLDPVGMTLGMAADVAEIFGQVGDEKAGTLVSAGLASIMQNLLSKTYLKGISDFLDVFTEAQRSENASKGQDYISRLVGSLVPSAVAQYTRVDDPTLRDTHLYEGFNAIVAGMKARIPGYAQDLPPRRNLWGEPIVLEGGIGPDMISPIYTSTEKESPVDDELLRLKLAIKMPPAHIDKIELTPHEYDRYVVLAGNEAKDPGTGLGFKDALAKLMETEEYKKQSDGIPDEQLEGGKQLMIRSYLRAYRELARQKLLEEASDLRELYRERMMDKAKALQGR